MTARPILCMVLDDTGLTGAARHAFDLIRYMDSRHFRIHVVSLAPAGALALEFQHGNVPVHALDLPLEGGFSEAWWSFAGTLTLFNLLRELRPSLVHAIGERALVMARVAARLAGVPWVVGSLRSRVGARGIRGLLDRITSSFLDVQLAASEVLAREVADRFGIHPARVRCIRPGIDLARFTAARRADIPAGSPVIGTVARLVPEKGIDVLVDATALLLRYHPDLRVVIAGRGSHAIRFVRRAQRLEIDPNVTFTGDLEDIPGILAALDVFVLPSRIEGAPLALIEALGAGRAVVASRLPAVMEIMDHEVHGLLVPAAHPALLADAIDRLLLDPGLRQRLASAGRSRVIDRHLAAPMAAAHQHLYTQLLDGLHESSSFRAASPRPQGNP